MKLVSIHDLKGLHCLMGNVGSNLQVSHILLNAYSAYKVVTKAGTPYYEEQYVDHMLA
jgi:hypothetical protein